MRELGVRIGNSGLGDKGWASQKEEGKETPCLCSRASGYAWARL